MLVDRIKRFFAERKTDRMRDRRAFYASELAKPARDLYWAATGEPETNPTDLIGNLKMLAGSILEDGLRSHVLQHLHLFGLHLLPGKPKVGGSDPVAVDGEVDGLFVLREEGGQLSDAPYVLEIKTKYGYGASMFKRDCDPGEAYLVQIGYYLRELHRLGVTNKGVFLFWLLGDDCFGEMIEILCRYESATDEVVAFKARHIDGEVRDLDLRVNIGSALARLKSIQGYIERKELPPADKRYRYPVTEELLSSVSDEHLRRMVKGEKVLGDWEIAYSRWKALHVAAEGGPGYSEAEQALIDAEYKRRVPKGRLVAQRKAG